MFAVRVKVDDKVRIGCRRVQTARRGCAVIGNSRQAALDIIFVHGLLFFHAGRPMRSIRIGERRELLGRDLDRFAVEGRKPVETELTAIPKNPNKNWKARQRKSRAAI